MEEEVLNYEPVSPFTEPTAKSNSIIGRLFDAESALEGALSRIETLEKQVNSLADIMGAHL